MRHDLTYASIPNMVRAAARAHGDSVALADDDVALTYAALESAVLDATRAFVALGVEPGDRVALCGPNSALWVLAALGIQGAGGVLVPINTRFKGTEITHILLKSDAVAFVTVGEFIGNRYVDMVRSEAPDARALERVVILDDAVVQDALPFSEAIRRGRETVTEASAVARIDAVRPESLSDVMFTSGTTGAPKGVMLTHAQSLRAYGNMGELLEVTADDSILVIPPFFHSFGYKAGWMMGFMFGMRVVPQRTFEPVEIMHKIQGNRVSCIFGPPTIFIDILRHPSRDEFDLSSLRVAVVSAASIPVQIIHDLKDVLGFDIVIAGYGLTEASAIVSIGRPSDDLDHIANTAGRAFDDVEVKAVDEQGRELPPGGEGELVVKGYNVMSGYWEDPEQTAETMTSDGWLRTGDIGTVDAEGYIRITDRKKDMFIVGGFNAYPAEIENILSRDERVQHVAVIGVPDERMGEVGAAFVVPVAGVEVSPADITSYAREHLANFKVPREVYIVDDLPRNASMKVLKHVLREERDARTAGSHPDSN